MDEDTKEDTLNEAIGVLTRREVEARLLGPLIRAFSERFGERETLETLRSVIEAAARQSGARMRQRAASDGLLAFAAGWEPWFRGGALEMDELEKTPERWSFNVTRCKYAELYRALGMAGLGETLSCCRDAALVEGFSDGVTLERSQTLMQGASHCDFRYRKGVKGTGEVSPPG
jgi:hypothetical protein